MKEKNNLIKEVIIFDAKPDAIPFNYRISYKVSLICMIIKECCGRRGCSLVKMHMIATAVSDREYEEKLKRYLQTQIPGTFVIRFEPSLNRALEYALADGFIVQQANGTYKLIDRGKVLVKEILNDDTVFQREKDVLEEIQCDLTEEKIKSLMEGWRYQNAKNQPT